MSFDIALNRVEENIAREKIEKTTHRAVSRKEECSLDELTPKSREVTSRREAQIIIVIACYSFRSIGRAREAVP